jgi:peptidoglycan hydrolase-like protein with peptidoglycan-binding domain
MKKDESKIVETKLTLDDVLKGKGSVKIGMKGPGVGEIQKLLIAAGYKNISKSGKVDNTFGSRTKSMVVDFQRATEGLNDDVIVGQNTLPKLKNASTKKSEYAGMGDDSPEFLQAQLDAQKSQLPVNHGKREIDDGGNPYVWDGYNEKWIPDSEYLQLYNTDGTKKLQENIIKNIVLKNLHSLL